MDSDIIRSEIDTTTRRIDEELRELDRRARQAARSAIAWTLIAGCVATLGVIAVTIAWRSRRRSRSEQVRQRSYETPMLPFGPIGMARRSVKSTSTA
jgi:hypothetical protein